MYHQFTQASKLHLTDGAKEPKRSAKPVHYFKLQMYHQCTKALKPQLPKVAKEQNVHCTMKVHVLIMRQD